MHSTPLCCVLLSLCLPASVWAGPRLTVKAGEQARNHTMVTVSAPKSWSGPAGLRDSSGRTIPAQLDGNGSLCFVVARLPAGASATFELVHPSEAASTSMTAAREGAKVRVNQAGRTMFDYQAEPSEPPRPDIKPLFRRGGYLHPLFTPGGARITDDYPANHLHHHGVWFPWTKTEFQGRHPDFWNMGDGSGRVEFASLDKTWEGPVLAGFESTHKFIDLTSGAPRVALNETWRVTAFNTGENPATRFLFDLESTQTCAGFDPLILPEYYYGGLGFRGNWSWNGTNNALFLTSEGATNSAQGNQTRGRWCYVGGMLEGRQAGVAILGHPSNFRAPQPMRLHPSEPFFCFAPSQLGQWRIEPGKPYISKYRFVTLDGPPDQAELDRWWNDYAHPPEAAWEP